MPLINWDNVKNPEDFSPIPDGQYLAQVESVEERSTTNGDERWNLKLEIIDGQFKGRHVFDGLMFTDNCLPRTKLVCSRLGVLLGGDFDLKPYHLVGKTAVIDVYTEDYVDDSGNTKKTNKIPFAGYSSTFTNPAQSPAATQLQQPVPQQAPMQQPIPQQPWSPPQQQVQNPLPFQQQPHLQPMQGNPNYPQQPLMQPPQAQYPPQQQPIQQQPIPQQQPVGAGQPTTNRLPF